MDDVVFDFADILKSETQDGTILLQTGSVDGPEVRSDETEFWQPSGYVSRPAKASPEDNPTASAQGVCIVRSDRDICIATRDVRANALVEALAEGEVQIFAGGPNNSGICKLVFNNDGNGNLKVTITVNTTKIEVLDGTVNITADSVNIAGASDYAALAQKVDDNFSALKTAISAATAGGSPITWTAPSTPSVAASDTRIS